METQRTGNKDRRDIGTRRSSCSARGRANARTSKSSTKENPTNRNNGDACDGSERELKRASQNPTNSSANERTLTTGGRSASEVREIQPRAGTPAKARRQQPRTAARARARRQQPRAAARARARRQQSRQTGGGMTCARSGLAPNGRPVP